MKCMENVANKRNRLIDKNEWKKIVSTDKSLFLTFANGLISLL